MKRTIFIQILFIFLISFTSLYAQWAKTYGGSNNDRAFSIQQTSDGGYIAAGYTESFGAGGRDIWVLKLDSNSTIEWQRAFGGSDDEWANSIQQTSDGGYIAAGISFSFGAGSGDFWILKLDSTGNIEWQVTYGGSKKDYAKSIQQTSDGGYIVEGQTYSFGSGWNDIWILKLSSVGEIEWQRTYGGRSDEQAWWIQQTNDGGYIAAGVSFSFGSGYSDFWVLKLDSEGNIEWLQTYGGRYNDGISVIQETSDGGYVATGFTDFFSTGYSDIWILKLDSEGEMEWQRTYGGSNSDYGHFIQQTSDEGYIVSGCTFSFGNGSRDGWIVKLTSIGDIEWQHTYGGSGYDCAHSIQQTSNRGYIAAGFTESFGAGSKDIWILKLDSSGEISPSCDFMGISSATITDSFLTHQDTYITPQETTVTPYDTSVFPQETEATVTLLCSNQEYTLTISTTPGGTTEPVPDTYTDYGGTKGTIAAIPDSGYKFSEWSGDASGSENPITITMDKDKSITANFIRQYTLTIAAGEGGTTNPTPGNHFFNTGTEVSITATPNADFIFSGWTGDVPYGSENDNPITINMDTDKSITANFIRSCQLKITSGNGGTTDPLPGTYTYNSGTEVDVTAFPEEGYEFSEWRGDASGSENPITITVDQDKWIKAIFTSPDEEDESSSWELNCFIATAAYDSPFHSHVEILRNFRDKYLITNKLGRKLVKLYYKYSPPLANIIAKHKTLKIAVRISLLPLVAFGYAMVYFGPIKIFTLGFLFIFSFFLSWFIVKRRKKRRQI